MEWGAHLIFTPRESPSLSSSSSSLESSSSSSTFAFLQEPTAAGFGGFWGFWAPEGGAREQVLWDFVGLVAFLAIVDREGDRDYTPDDALKMVKFIN